MHDSETPFKLGFYVQFWFKSQMTWPEICKAEGQEGCTLAAILFLPTNMAVETVTCWWRDEQGRARSSFWGCEAWSAGHRAPIWWVTAGWCDPGAGSGLSSQTFLILVAFWWRQFLGCGILWQCQGDAGEPVGFWLKREKQPLPGCFGSYSQKPILVSVSLALPGLLWATQQSTMNLFLF